MMKHIALAIVILLASCAAGAIARSTWYNADKKFPAMTWVKGGSTPNETTTARKRPAVDDDAPRKQPAKTVESDPEVAVSDVPPADPCECSHRVEGFCVAEIDCVLKHLGENTAYIIDAREDRDYNESRLLGSIHIPSSSIYDNIQNVMAVVPTRQDMIIVYCGGGQCEASKNVGIVLREFEYKNVWLYEKGWEEVEASGRFGDYIEIGG